jgi:hypothetical protein
VYQFPDKNVFFYNLTAKGAVQQEEPLSIVWAQPSVLALAKAATMRVPARQAAWLLITELTG